MATAYRILRFFAVSVKTFRVLVLDQLYSCHIESLDELPNLRPLFFSVLSF